MNAGELNRRISILNQTNLPNSYGEVENTWNTLAITWAKVRTLQGRELFQAGQVHADVTVKVTIRYRDDVQTNMQIQYGNRTFRIVYIVNVDEDYRYLELSCKEVI
jgi:SPP1 family predicted phage head-tail adaptor